MRPWADPSSPWRTTDECAAYLRFITKKGQLDRESARQWLEKRGVAKCHRGRVVMYRRESVEAALEVRRAS